MYAIRSYYAGRLRALIANKPRMAPRLLPARLIENGKLYIKTFGCQMNEYDSARVADVLAASHRLTLTDDRNNFV